ncbi:MAG TPA: polymer-forming cytoskeletal protein [Terriglobales bacterium]|nr:polymer-forming cytoskeletal protein [Terriglobales bacterium]
MDPVKNDNYRPEMAHIGKSVLVKGELSGSEDLYLDGEVEGSIELRGHSLIIGPHGRVRANIHARDIVVHGKVEGNVRGTDRVELKKSAILMGDISTQRILIEDGAYFKGGIETQKGDAKADGAKPEAKAASASTSSSSASPAVASYSSQGASASTATAHASSPTAQNVHPSLLEKKY